MNKALLKLELQSAIENFKAAIERHPDINIKRADGGWTVGEIADHIIKSTQANFGATKKGERPYDQFAEEIKGLFLNFNVKLPAMTELLPTPGKHNAAELISKLEKNKNSIVKLMGNDDLTEVCIEIELPVWGCLTKYEWMVLCESHIIRHTKQINDFNKPVLS